MVSERMVKLLATELVLEVLTLLEVLRLASELELEKQLEELNLLTEKQAHQLKKVTLARATV